MDYDEMDAYEFDAEDRFDNFDEDYEYEYEPDEFEVLEVEEDDYDSYEPVEYLEVEDDYDDYAGTQMGQLDPNDTTYTVVVNNTTANEEEVVIFGANEAILPPAGVTIEVAESSHNEVREESKANPFTIVGMKMSVSDTSQFDNVLNLVEKTSGGRFTTYVKQPRNYQSPQNQDKNLIHAVDFTMQVTGKSSIRFKAKPGKTTFTFSVQFRTNIGNVLSGRNVAEVNSAPQATGLPQIDLQRLKPRTALPMPSRKAAASKPRKVIARPVRSAVSKVRSRTQGAPRKVLKRVGGGMRKASSNIRSRMPRLLKRGRFRR